jgi:hypothetical protein
MVFESPEGNTNRANPPLLIDFLFKGESPLTTESTVRIHQWSRLTDGGNVTKGKVVDS